MNVGSIGRLADQILEEVSSKITKTAEHTLLKEAEASCLKTDVGRALHKLAAVLRSNSSEGVSLNELKSFVKRAQ